jgi:very-short-patch-repair endonuclease
MEGREQLTLLGSSLVRKHKSPPIFVFQNGGTEGGQWPQQEQRTMKKSNRSSSKMIHRAGELRQEPSPAEAKLWAYLRAHRIEGIHFRRQHAIGPYITDFCAPSQKLIIELDGSQHLDQEEYDAERTVYLETRGYQVLRFWNSDVMNDISGVMGRIIEELQMKE